MINYIKELERDKVICLNLKGWNLKPSKYDDDVYDAYGRTPAGSICYIEMKFRNDYYETKLLEKKKYDSLMKLVGRKFYYVNDKIGEYLFALDRITMPPVEQRYCPETTFWGNKKVIKDVYLLEERQALKIIAK